MSRCRCPLAQSRFRQASIASLSMSLASRWLPASQWNRSRLLNLSSQSGEAAPAAAESPNPAVAPAPAVASPPVTPWLMICMAALVPVLLIAVGALIYFKRIVPRRNLEPYHKAVTMLQAARYGDALPLLTEDRGQALRRYPPRGAFLLSRSPAAWPATTKKPNALPPRCTAKIFSDLHVAYLLAWILCAERNTIAPNRYWNAWSQMGSSVTGTQNDCFGIVKFARANEAFRKRARGRRRGAVRKKSSN